ncbi:hypothetical protein [Candidatus Accumulibacter phosphatis]|uniref:hypothetical protein n=1 Tax=Candidatus Accumulibacter phosphatis TaxID=327160 RepID=UPI00145C81C2|nr:hypothetical protein [Candidatus Accumulibacter phosphatis]
MPQQPDKRGDQQRHAAHPGQGPAAVEQTGGDGSIGGEAGHEFIVIIAHRTTP